MTKNYAQYMLEYVKGIGGRWKMKEIFEKLREGILVINKNNQIQFCNSSLSNLLEYDKKYIEGLCLKKICIDIQVNDIEDILKDKKISLYTKSKIKKEFKLEAVEFKWKSESAICLVLEEFKESCNGEKDLEELIITILEECELYKRLEKQGGGESFLELNGLKKSLYNYYEDSELNILKNEILNELNIDGFSIWIYDEKENEIISQIRGGICEYINSGKIRVKINENAFQDAVCDGYYGKIRRIDEFKESTWKNQFKGFGVGHIGLYDIRFDNKFLGVLSLLYKSENMPDFSYDSFFTKVSERIGIIIRNKQLSMEVKTQLRKRVEIERELENYLETATDLMAVADEKGKFIRASNGWEKLLGCTKEEVLNLNWREMILPEIYEENIQELKGLNVKGGEVKRIVNRYIGKDSKVTWLDLGIQYKKENKIFMITAKDITEKKRIEEQNKNYEKAMRLEKSKSEFLSNMSHEFKTPLNIILATTQMINKGIENNFIIPVEGFALKKYINSIKQNSYRLLRLINNLIDITKIDSGFYKLNLENHDIVSIVEDITISVAQYVENKGINLIFDTEIEEKVIACDPDKIERIMLNLLSNAIKYTNINGKIKVDMKLGKDDILVYVRDNGIGIPEDKIKGIFDRFIQVDNELTRRNQGNGIGLSLVKSLVELHEGKINASSKLGEGTEIIFTLPISKVDKSKNIKMASSVLNSKVEKCDIEFSDIYNL